MATVVVVVVVVVEISHLLIILREVDVLDSTGSSNGRARDRDLFLSNVSTRLAQRDLNTQ